MNKPIIIEVYSEPNEYRIAPQYSLAVAECAPHTVWVQLNPDDETPQWEEFCSIYDAVQFLRQIEKNTL